MKTKYHVTDEDLILLNLVTPKMALISTKMDGEEYEAFTELAFRMRRKKSAILREFLETEVLGREAKQCLLEIERKKLAAPKAMSFLIRMEQKEELETVCAMYRISISVLLRNSILHIIGQDRGRGR